MNVGIVIFPRLTQLDATGPFEVFARMPQTAVHLVSQTLAPVASDFGLVLTPTTTFATAPPLDIVCVPGGVGVNALLSDQATLAYLQREAATARFVTSVCTGALVLGAAGLLRGYRATTHWLSLEFLSAFGAEPVNARWVVDRNRITGGGVTAGIDFALAIAALLHGDDVAREIQLMIEYAPSPPFDSGSTETAPAEVIARVRAQRADGQVLRRKLVKDVTES